MLSQIVNVVLLLIPPMIFAIYGSLKEPSVAKAERSAEFYNPQPKNHVFFSAKHDSTVKPLEGKKKAPCNIRQGERLMVEEDKLTENKDTLSYEGALTVVRLDGIMVRCSLSKGSFNKTDFIRY